MSLGKVSMYFFLEQKIKVKEKHYSLRKEITLKLNITKRYYLTHTLVSLTKILELR